MITSTPPLALQASMNTVALTNQSSGSIVVESCGRILSWQEAAGAARHDLSCDRIVVQLEEFLAEESTRRFAALVAVCQKGVELVFAISGSNTLPPTTPLRVPLPSAGRDVIGQVRWLLPFEATFLGVNLSTTGDALYRFRVESEAGPFKPIWSEPPTQEAFSGKAGAILLGRGFYGAERVRGELSYYMEPQGSVYVSSALDQLVKVSLRFKPVVSRPQQIDFHGNVFELKDEAVVVAYASVIKGSNPFIVKYRGVAESPKDRGESDDSRTLAARLVGAELAAMS